MGSTSPRAGATHPTTRPRPVARNSPLHGASNNEKKKGLIENWLANYLDHLESLLPSIHSYTGFIQPLRKNNFHLQRGNLFNTPDTRTLVSAAADIPTVAEQGDL